MSRLLQLGHVLGGLYETERHVIYVLGRTPHQVGPVLRRDDIAGEVGIRQVDALALYEYAGVFGRSVYDAGAYAGHLGAQFAVVQIHVLAALELLGQVVLRGQMAGLGIIGFVLEAKLLPFGYGDYAVKVAQAYLRPLQVLDYSHRLAVGRAGPAYPFDLLGRVPRACHG